MTLTFALAFLFLLLDFLRGESSLNEAAMGLAVDPLVTGRVVNVSTTMMFDVFRTHLEFETSYAFLSSEADGRLCQFEVVGRVSSHVFGTMGLETGVTEKVPSTGITTLRGFETALVSVEKIGTTFLATGVALEIVFAAVTFLIVVGFQAGGTDVTGAEKPRETCDDIIVTFLVEQNELFG